MPIRALLFDFDGLIVDTESPSLAAWRRVYAEHGQELSLERWSAAVGTIGGFDALAYLESLVGSPLEREALRTPELEHQLTLVQAGRPRPGAAEDPPAAARPRPPPANRS